MSTNYLPVILSGGPGSGKTTLLNELARRGYACVAEAAREIIREQIATQGDALPWKNRRRYTAIMLKRTIADFDRYREQGGLFFFDRGIPDTLAYARLIRLYLDKHSRHEALARRYVPTVFPATLEIHLHERYRTAAEFHDGCPHLLHYGQNIPRTRLPDHCPAERRSGRTGRQAFAMDKRMKRAD